MNGLRMGLAAAALVVVSACGGESEAETPKTFDVTGEVALFAQGSVLPSNGVCIGIDGYSDLRGGAAVTVFDADGKKVGIGELGGGESGDDQYTDCIFGFTVEDVPAGGDIFSIEVSNRGEVNFKPADADSIKLALG